LPDVGGTTREGGRRPSVAGMMDDRLVEGPFAAVADFLSGALDRVRRFVGCMLVGPFGRLFNVGGRASLAEALRSAVRGTAADVDAVVRRGRPWRYERGRVRRGGACLEHHGEFGIVWLVAASVSGFRGDADPVFCR